VRRERPWTHRSLDKDAPIDRAIRHVGRVSPLPKERMVRTVPRNRGSRLTVKIADFYNKVRHLRIHAPQQTASLFDQLVSARELDIARRRNELRNQVGHRRIGRSPQAKWADETSLLKDVAL
jgi:hypothetical protein